ncbi:hypothetical protein [Haloferula sargassicola]|uniref:Uncharacterized protein n=1 Tax=Haloferula sargassicola TaxID=490096 RepID=A0ABP9UPU0_9BACT
MNPQVQAIRFPQLSQEGADKRGYACGDLTARNHSFLFEMGHGGPGER